MASYEIENPPENLSMQDFRSINDRYGSLAKSCRYVVRIFTPRNIAMPGSTTIPEPFSIEDLTYLCESTEFPGRAFTNIDVRHYGPTYKMPNLSVYEDLNITFLCRTDSLEREFFDDWMEGINPTNTFDFNYRNTYATTIQLFQMAESGEATYEFALFDCFPIFVNPQPVTWADDNAQRLTVTFTYTKWRRAKDYKKPLNKYVNWNNTNLY